jgi:hypothetical protein
MKVNKTKEERAASTDSKKRKHVGSSEADKVEAPSIDKDKDDLLVIKQSTDDVSNEEGSVSENGDEESDVENGDAASDVSDVDEDAPKKDEYEYDSSDEEVCILFKSTSC